MSASGHRQVEHTADLAFELWGDTETAVLVEGMRAVVAVLVEGEPVAARDERSVELDALDACDRLVRWLNEVLYLATTCGFIPAEATIELTEEGLTARLRGEADASERLKTEVKSATYHDLQLQRRGDGFIARVVMDV